MGDYAEQLIEQEMFGSSENYKHIKGSWKRTPAEKKIASIRKEIAVNCQSGMSIDDSRKSANLKYGKGWRERGLISNSPDQWSDEDLQDFR